MENPKNQDNTIKPNPAKVYIAHKREDGGIQTMVEHLTGTAMLCAQFCEAFQARSHGYRTGLLHDRGKYSTVGQKRMWDPEHTAKVDHSTAGAQMADDLKDPPASMVIAGHHGGLLDAGNRKFDTDQESTLYGRFRRWEQRPDNQRDCEAFDREIQLSETVEIPRYARENLYKLQFYIRMLFSSLVDADYLDTEQFMQCGRVERGVGDGIGTLYQRLCCKVSKWLEQPEDGSLNARRTEILRKCLDGGSASKGLFTLTVPTGGGKTVSSLAFALAHARAHGMSRVIYVIPYTSIIEQNAAVFEDMLGAENVLEHHSNVDTDEAEDADELQLKKRRATENWDAPVIVTTAVQFFESLYGNKPSRCRKLHNLSNAVIIFDEAQMMPIPYLRPCVAAIGELVEHYGTTAVLCTATQPALDELLKKYAPDKAIRELCPDDGTLADCFRRVRFEIEEDTLTNEMLAQRLQEQEQVLCILNSRKLAQEIYQKLEGEGCFHLSTLMTPRHRRKILDEIRRRLSPPEAQSEFPRQPCRVVSTSLIEAGVDVDFPTVYRQQAGLDSILQAAGRCNREGKKPTEESVVTVFRSEGASPKMFEKNIAATNAALRDGRAVDAPETMHQYFLNLIQYSGPAIDQYNIMKMCDTLSFAKVSEKFHLIGTETKRVYIPTDDNGALLEQLRDGAYSKQLLRTLGQDCVSVYPQHFKKLMEAGVLEPLDQDSAILTDPRQYDAQIGLLLEPKECGALFV